MTLLKKNKDLFASRDKHLGRMDTVRMKIDTGDSFFCQRGVRYGCFLMGSDP